MHEASLARQILTAVLEAAPGERVSVVRGWLAETETLRPDSLQLHFDAAAAGTPAEGARLELRLVHVGARCLGCAHEYLPEHHLTICPSCGSTEGELLGETGLGVDQVVLAE